MKEEILLTVLIILSRVKKLAVNVEEGPYGRQVSAEGFFHFVVAGGKAACP